MGPVEKAIRTNINPGQILQTPDIYKSAKFKVKSFDGSGIILLFGAQETPTLISWSCLEGIPDFLKDKDWVQIGTIFDTSTNSATLDAYLKQWIKKATAGWVAVVLEKAQIIEIDRVRPMKVKLQQSV